MTVDNFISDPLSHTIMVDINFAKVNCLFLILLCVLVVIMIRSFHSAIKYDGVDDLLTTMLSKRNLSTKFRLRFVTCE